MADRELQKYDPERERTQIRMRWTSLVCRLRTTAQQEHRLTATQEDITLPFWQQRRLCLSIPRASARG